MHNLRKGSGTVIGLAMDDPAISEWSKLLTNGSALHFIIK